MAKIVAFNMTMDDVATGKRFICIIGLTIDNG
jgi:hypothetical protein